MSVGIIAGMKTISEKMREQRERIRVSQKTLAELIKAQQNQVSRWETDQSEVPHIFLIRMADLFEVPVRYLIDDQIDEVAEAAERPALDPAEAQILELARMLGRERALARLLMIEGPLSPMPSPPSDLATTVQRRVIPKPQASDAGDETDPKPKSSK